MGQAATNQQFERALYYRDLIYYINYAFVTLVLPVFANQYNRNGNMIRNVAAMEEAQLIHKDMPHWAEFQLFRMQESFQQEVLMMKGGLDAEISYVDFERLVRLTLDSSFSANLIEFNL